MALRKRGDHWFGDSQADIRDELSRYGKVNEYVPAQFADAVCVCGSRTFRLSLDEDQGVAVRICTACCNEHPMGDSNEYLEHAELEERACVCGVEIFEITVGVSLYEGSEDVKWLYVGCRCPACGLVGCYGDWKNEFLDYRKLLDRV